MKNVVEKNKFGKPFHSGDRPEAQLPQLSRIWADYSSERQIVSLVSPAY